MHEAPVYSEQAEPLQCLCDSLNRANNGSTASMILVDGIEQAALLGRATNCS